MEVYDEAKRHVSITPSGSPLVLAYSVSIGRHCASEQVWYSVIERFQNLVS